MSEREDELELEALQRRLDDAFETTRPRRGFEDELWLRMQRRRPLGERVRDALAGLVAGFREAPAVPLGALALILVVVIGITAIGSGAFGANHNSASTAMAPNAGGAGKGTDFYGGGQIPTPALHPGVVDSHAPAVPQTGPSFAAGAPAHLYFGPANLQWTGTFALAQPNASVFVYAEPTSAQLQASIATFAPTPVVTVETRGTISQLPLEPTLVLTEHSAGAVGTDPLSAAVAFLQQHNAIGSWLFAPIVDVSGGVTRVVLQRMFPTSNSDHTALVDWNGERYGAEVDIVDGKRTATGPLPLDLQVVNVPLISNDQAAQLAVSEAPAGTAAISPTPTVNLDHVELVYALAYANQHGFYEPAYLFSGSFTYNGQTYVKRVLVPLVAPNFRS